MDKKTSTMIACPNCGHKQKNTIWSIVDGAVNPRVKKKLLDGTIFDRKCPECGAEYALPYTMLYKDDDRRVMIYYADSLSCLNDARETIMERRKSVDGDKDYTIRIATTPNELREKVRIFDMGMDDRFIEIMKIALLEKVRTMRGGGIIDEVRCWVQSNKNLEFTIIGDKNGMTTSDSSFYDYVVEKCGKMASRQYPNPSEVDLDWAIEFMARNHFVVE